MQKNSFLFLVLFCSLINAQTSFTITGRVLDNDNKMITVGDVLLLADKDNTLIKYTILNELGFKLEDIASGTYRIQISSLGFETYERNLIVDRNKGLSIKLEPSTTTLEEVAVIAAKPITTNKRGDLKIDVTNPVFSSIPDPMELLSRLPSLQVSADRESVSVLGKGAPLMYMGNQRISMEEFYAVAVDDISSIEIIRNPSAKYEANGRAVLLITRKINNIEGGKVNLSETLSFKRNFNKYSDINGSYKKGKVTLKANLAYNDLLQWESHQFEFAIPDANILSDYLILVDKNDRVEINSGGGLFYQINDTDYFSANVTHRLQDNNAIIDTDTFLRQGTNEDDIITETDNENIKDFISGNLNYQKKLSAKTNMFAGLQYSSYDQRLNTEIANNFNATEFVISELRKQRYRINVLAYRLDFDEALTQGLKWEFGANISDARANALTNNEFLETDAILDIDYDYSEKNIAGYSTLSGKISEKIDFSAGLRIENNVVQGEEEAEDIPLVNRKNTNLFPKANLTVALDSTKNITFNYAKSIDRPNYSNASSIQVFFNPFLEGEGNVNLLPTLTDELSVVYQFAKNSISIEYYKRKNPMYYTISYTAGDDRAVFSLKNLERESGIDINFTAPMTKGIWTSSNTVSISTKNIRDASATSTSIRPYLYLYTDHQFKLRKDTVISLGGWGLTKRSEGIFERNPMLVLNAAITKTFFDRLKCSLRFNDITKAMNFEERYSINGVNAEGVYFVDAQEVAFSMKYSFGKTKEPDYKNKNVDENLDRIR
ncbi:outer membrane beta-barrel family protein [Costertonia aggregata]|uniref:TonB-dependent receptor n=1 Tax=Costertonia aggregata TaxID=343403 RepID=A0A7H9ALW8_9FLAO|nr:outer membrane beta-barrel family protein [Costertonia aggregata]QLG44439.1 TonB-dependent receptor [Costertonia aggregata]